MGRAAGDSHAYTWKLKGTRKGETYELNLPSVTHILHSVKDEMGFGGMAWWGYKIGIRALHPDADDDFIEEMYEAAKETDYTPNKVRDQAGGRGTDAHDLAESLARGDVHAWEDDEGVVWVAGEPKILAKLQGLTQKEWGDGEAYVPVEYQRTAALYWLSEEHAVAFAERPVWSLKHGFGGTLDRATYLAEEYDPSDRESPLEIVDYKTHKPSTEGRRKDGSYREGTGPGYLEDRLQLSAYAVAVSELHLGVPLGTRVVLFGPDGTWEEDTRGAPFEWFLAVKQLHDGVCRRCS